MYSRIRYTGKRNRTSTLTAVGGLLPEVRMTLEEYEALTGQAIGVTLNPHIFKQSKSERGRRKQTKKKLARKGKKDPKMARALKQANAKARKKNGSFKKGYDQARVMREAHKIRRRMK